MVPTRSLRSFWTILFTLTILLQTACAASLEPRDEDKHVTFVNSNPYGNLTFAPVADVSNGDLYFHLEAPAGNSWVSVGIGSEMKSALIWVFYRSSNGKGVTLCSRTTTGHVEPTHNPDVECDLIERDGITNGIQKVNNQDVFVANVHCKGVNKNSYGAGDYKVDFASNTHPFIFAYGPTDRKLRSDEKGADIRRHSLFGQFTLDLAATVVNSTDDIDFKDFAAVGNWQNDRAQLSKMPTDDSEWAGSMHAFMMCGVFVVIFPLGVVFLRLLDQVKWHGWMQGVGLGFLLGGLGLGVWVGTMYNRSKDFKNPHQIIGIASISLALFQFALGFLHHYLYTHRQSYRPTFLNLIHKHLGLPVLLLGAVNGFLGFNFAGGTWHKIAYPIIAGVVYLALAGALVWVKKVKSKKRKRVEDRRLQDEAFEAFKHQGAGYGYGEEDDRDDRRRGREETHGAVSLREMSNDRGFEEYSRPERPRAIV